MQKIRMLSDDEIEILKQKQRAYERLDKVVQLENDELRTIKEFAKYLTRISREKQNLIDEEKKLLQLVEIAVKNPVSDVSEEEIRSLKKSIDNLEKTSVNQLNLSEAFTDLHMAMKEFLQQKNDYKRELSTLVSLREKWQSLVYDYLKAENRMVAEKKLENKRRQIHDIDTKIKRSQNIVDRKKEWLVDNVKTLDKAWQKVRENIRDFGW
ncbi:MAG: hypothetical protein JW776_10885 [Candidatus Lokiarchaeota archaeon]|nr:hypothetical protein [Candidatus Lokiarchaeota archaeon]